MNARTQQHTYLLTTTTCKVQMLRRLLFLAPSLKIIFLQTSYDFPLSSILTVVCKKVHKIWSVWCKMALGEVSRRVTPIPLKLVIFPLWTKGFRFKKGFSNLEPAGKGGGIIMGVTRLLLLGPFYTIQTNFMYYFAHNCTLTLNIWFFRYGRLMKDSKIFYWNGPFVQVCEVGFRL